MSYMKQENLDFDMDPSQLSSNLGDGSHGEYNHPAVQSSQNTITAFLAKLWALVNDATCDDLIAWDVSGASFHVYDQARFAREILPRYFKHNNFASFIRQLNMYGFRKISNIEHGSLKNERDDIEFAHPHFIRGQESTLELIKRRAPDSQQRSGVHGGANASSALAGANYLDSKSGRSFEYSHLLEDVRSLQTKQTSLSDKLSYMQTENQALWNEIGSLRQKHSRQQQIVSKLMEFLLQFISNASAHHQDQSVHRQVSNEVLHTDASNPQSAPNQQPANNPLLVLSEQALSPDSLKRKYTALAHLDEPNKRANTQQQQQQEQGVRPPNLGRQQSVTINELTDHESSGWHHASNASPVIDLVPSPPPSIHSADDNHQLQQSAGDCRWSPTALGQNQQPKSTLPTVGNRNGAHTTYTPDFYLRPDGTHTPAANGGKPSPVAPQNAAAAPLKEELLGLPQPYQQTTAQQPIDLKTSPTLYSQNQQQHKIGQGGEQLSFSLDDITGDVDHIQCSLDNIRDLMFDNLPEGTSIEDFFGDDNALLLPLLDPSSTTDQTPNLLLESIKDQKLMSNESQSNDGNGAANSQSVPNLNDALIEQLKTKTATVEEQKVAIDQLAHKNSLLEDRIHHLEQEKAQPK